MFVITSEKNRADGRNKDISADMLKKLVKASGDGCVTGYVRFRRIKECKGYEQASKKAARHLSVIKAGRPVGDNRYAAVVRFRLIVYLIPAVLLMLGALFFISRRSDVGALEIETTSAGRILPDSTVPEIDMESMYAGLYISVPGFSDMVWEDDTHGLAVYNPADNQCVMQYKVRAAGEIIAESGRLNPGEREKIDLTGRLGPGVYELEIIADSCSLDDGTQFNSVYQQVTLTVYQEVNYD